jgi:hypothetical protein
MSGNVFAGLGIENSGCMKVACSACAVRVIRLDVRTAPAVRSFPLCLPRPNPPKMGLSVIVRHTFPPRFLDALARSWEGEPRRNPARTEPRPPGIA